MEWNCQIIDVPELGESDPWLARVEGSWALLQLAGRFYRVTPRGVSLTIAGGKRKCVGIQPEGVWLFDKHAHMATLFEPLEGRPISSLELDPAQVGDEPRIHAGFVEHDSGHRDGI